MRIVHVNPPYETVPTLSEGRARSALMITTNEIAKRLSNEHKFMIFSPGDEQHPQGTICDQGVRYSYTSPNLHRLERKLVNGLLNVEALFNYPRRKRPIIATKWYFLAYIKQVARTLSQEKWDIIHIHDFPQFAPILRAAVPNAKIIVHMHCLRLSQFDPDLMRRYLAATDMVIVVGKFIADEFITRFPDWADRCRILNNGVDINQFLLPDSKRSASDKLQLLFVGRVSPEKGVHVLLKAFAQLAPRYPQLELNVIGGLSSIGYSYLIPMSDDPVVGDLNRFYTPLRKRDAYRQHLLAMIPPELTSRVHFTGSVPHTQVQNYLVNATAFIFPSVWHEPFSNALIEGMASGVPLVATCGGGNTEIIEAGKTGLVVERNNVDALAQAISQLIENPDLRNRLSVAAQERIKHLFNWDQLANLLLDHYQSAVGQQRD